MIERRLHMTRAVRTARGILGALFATLLAAASHSLAGGTVTAFALLATGMVALPICVALSGRIASLWRLSLAVVISQFLYHWTFAGLGLSAGTPSEAVNPHAGHMTDSFIPMLSGTFASADVWMWISHGVTSLITIALLYRGEIAATGFARIVRRALPRVMRSVVPVAFPSALRTYDSEIEPLRTRFAALSAISHRGPPLFLAYT